MTTAEWIVLGWLVVPFLLLGFLALIAKLRRSLRREQGQVIVVNFDPRWSRRVG